MKINNGSISYSSVNDDAEEKYQVKEDDYIIEQNKQKTSQEIMKKQD